MMVKVSRKQKGEKGKRLRRYRGDGSSPGWGRMRWKVSGKSDVGDENIVSKK